LVVLHALVWVVSALLFLLWGISALGRIVAATLLLVWRGVVVVSSGTAALDVCGLRRGDAAWVGAIGGRWRSTRCVLLVRHCGLRE
jgi:hypothetical protein